MKKSWIKAWIIQFLIMTAACILQTLTNYLSPVLHNALLWGGIPILGFYTAYRAVLGGLLNYAAWIAPPVCMFMANIIVWGYAPHMGPILLCAFISLVGAAAGDVMVRENNKKKK